MKIIVAATLCFALLGSTAAKAAEPGDASRVEGDALIAEAHAQGIFENITKGGSNAPIRLRHRASGMVCDFLAGSAFKKKLTLFPAKAPGDDVGCNQLTPRSSVSFYAIRTRGITLDQAAEMGGKALQMHVAGSEPVQIDDKKIWQTASLYANSNLDKLPESRTLYYLSPDTYERFSVSFVNGWELSMRFSGHKGNDGVISSDVAWMWALKQIADPKVEASEP